MRTLPLIKKTVLPSVRILLHEYLAGLGSFIAPGVSGFGIRTE